jgi:hypothetical protein
MWYVGLCESDSGTCVNQARHSSMQKCGFLYGISILLSFFLYLFLISLFPSFSVYVWYILGYHLKNVFTLSCRCCSFASHISRVIHGFVTQVTNCDTSSVQDLNMHTAVTASFRTNVYYVICIRFVSKRKFFCDCPFRFLCLSTMVTYFNLCTMHPFIIRIMNKQMHTWKAVYYTVLYLSLLHVSTLTRHPQGALIRCLLSYINVLTLNLPTTTIVAQPFLMFCWPCIIVT